MEQNKNEKATKPKTKSNDSTAIRFENQFLKQVTKLVEKANKKQFGRKVKPKTILVNLLALADEKLLDSVIKKSQSESLSLNDEMELQFKDNMTKFSSSKEKFQEKMKELMGDFLSQNPA